MLLDGYEVALHSLDQAGLHLYQTPIHQLCLVLLTFPNLMFLVCKLIRPSIAFTEWTYAEIRSFSLKISLILSLSCSILLRCSPPGSRAAVSWSVPNWAAPISSFHLDSSTDTTLPTTTSPISGTYLLLKGITVSSLILRCIYRSVCFTFPAKRENIFPSSSKVPVPLSKPRLTAWRWSSPQWVRPGSQSCSGAPFPPPLN